MADRVEQLEELRRKVADLRREQRAFFAATPQTSERSRALHASKALERQVDELVQQLAGDAPRCPACEGRGTEARTADLFDVGNFGKPCKACGGRGRR